MFSLSCHRLLHDRFPLNPSLAASCQPGKLYRRYPPAGTRLTVKAVTGSYCLPVPAPENGFSKPTALRQKFDYVAEQFHQFRRTAFTQNGPIFVPCISVCHAVQIAGGRKHGLCL